MSGTSVSQSAGFFTETRVAAHRTGVVTDDHELHAAYARIVSRALTKYGAEDLREMLFGDGE